MTDPSPTPPFGSESWKREAALRRLNRFKQSASPPAEALGAPMVQFFKQTVEKRQAKFGRIAESWSRLVPQLLDDHCALDSFHRGTLTVLVDSAPHLYELKQLMLAGLQQQLLLACRSAGLRKISLRPGRWYDDGEDGRQKVRFESGPPTPGNQMGKPETRNPKQDGRRK